MPLPTKTVLAFALILCFAWVGCSNVPYRVQWGKQNPAEQNLSANPNGTAENQVKQSLNTLVLKWRGRHSTVERLIKSRSQGDPLPLNKIRSCQSSIQKISEHYLEAARISFLNLKPGYDQLIQSGSSGSIFNQLNRLKKIETQMNTLLESAVPERQREQSHD